MIPTAPAGGIATAGSLGGGHKEGEMEYRWGEAEQNDEGKGEGSPNREPDRETLARRAAERLEEIHQYLRDREARREVIERTVTQSGQELDWVPIEAQAPEGKIADPPSEDGLDLRDRERPADGEEYRAYELLPFELTRDDAVVGPQGTVPVVKRDIVLIRPTGTLQDFLSKHGRAAVILPDEDPREFAPPEDGTVHKYAYSAQYTTCYGGEGYINAWDPYIEWSNEFSLGQTALARGSGSGKQTIEAGHQEYRDLYGDWVPHLFIFYTTNGYTSSGDNKGGYNRDVDGWVQYSNSIYPGALSSPLSQFGGTQYVMQLKWQLWQGNWWLRVNGIWIGYYPASLFSTSGLRSQADKMAWYGEVVDSGDHAGTTATDMGNGHWPYEGWQRCAYMSHLYYQSSTGGALSRYDPGSVYATNSACYDIEGHFSNTGSWGPYFWWGGSGRNPGCP
jgi:Neprosin